MSEAQWLQAPPPACQRVAACVGDHAQFQGILDELAQSADFRSAQDIYAALRCALRTVEARKVGSDRSTPRMSLSWDLPRAVAVRHRIDPHSQGLNRTVIDARNDKSRTPGTGSGCRLSLARSHWWS